MMNFTEQTMGLNRTPEIGGSAETHSSLGADYPHHLYAERVGDAKAFFQWLTNLDSGKDESAEYRGIPALYQHHDAFERFKTDNAIGLKSFPGENLFPRFMQFFFGNPTVKSWSKGRQVREIFQAVAFCDKTNPQDVELLVFTRARACHLILMVAGVVDESQRRFYKANQTNGVIIDAMSPRLDYTDGDGGLTIRALEQPNGLIDLYEDNPWKRGHSVWYAERKGMM